MVGGCFFFFFQAEDGIRDLVRSRGLGDVYKRQPVNGCNVGVPVCEVPFEAVTSEFFGGNNPTDNSGCLLYTSDAADERSSVDLGGRRIIKKKNNGKYG